MPSLFMEHNQALVNPTPFSGYSQATQVVHYDGTTGAVFAGYVIVWKNTLNGVRYGVYDLSREQEALPTVYTQISFRGINFRNEAENRLRALYYANVTDSDGRTGLYRLHERRFVIALDDYFGFTYNNMIIDNVNTKIIELVTAEGALTVHNIITFGENNAVIRTEKSQATTGDFIDGATRNKINNFPKLKDFTYDISGNFIVGYKNDKKVFTVELPAATPTVTFYIDKYYVAQIVSNVDQEADKFTFIEDGRRYNLYTYYVDLTNGKFAEVKDFNYRMVGGAQVRYDKNKEYTLYEMNVQMIEAKNPLPTVRILFDSKLKPLVNLTAKQYTPSYFKIAEKRFLSLAAVLLSTKTIILF